MTAAVDALPETALFVVLVGLGYAGRIGLTDELPIGVIGVAVALAGGVRAGDQIAVLVCVAGHGRAVTLDRRDVAVGVVVAAVAVAEGVADSGQTSFSVVAVVPGAGALALS